MNTLLHLYTPINYAITGEPITMSLFVSTSQGYRPIDSITNSNFVVNFNDYTTSNYICSFIDHKFQYTYIGAYDPATISITANYNSSTVVQTFTSLRIDSKKAVADLNILRTTPKESAELPHPQVYVPINEIASTFIINDVFNKIYDNFEYLLNLCKVYKIKPERIGWGGFEQFIPSSCYEVSSTSISSVIPTYGVIGNTNKVVKLENIPSMDYEFGSSLFQLVSTISKNNINVVPINSFYTSNFENHGVQLLTSTNLDISTITNATTNIPFTHTIIDYQLTDFTGSSVVPIESDVIVIKSCDKNALVQTYELSGTILPINTTYTPKTINWNLKNQFKYDFTITSANTYERINDILVTNDNILYITRGSFIEKYDISTPNKEMIFTTQTIDISETFTNAKSVAITDNGYIHMLDNTRHLVHIYEIDEIVGKIYSTGKWGSLGGVQAQTGFYKPNQLFSYNNFIYICDTFNKAVKKYNSQGNWIFTYKEFLPENSSDTVISACVDINNNLQIITENLLILLDSTGKILKTTETSFNSKPIKIVTNSDGGLLYICCEREVYRYHINHKFVNVFAKITDTDTSLSSYTSIAVDKHNAVYLTDGNFLIKYLDIPETFQIRSTATDSQFWTREQIYINRNELVDDWVYNRSIRRLAENIDILYKTLEYKIVPVNEEFFMIAPYDDTDVGAFQGLPISTKDLCAIGINEFVTSEVINRCIDGLQQNIYYILCVILNCFTFTKAGLEVNFAVAPPVLPDCCWNWFSRQSGRCCTPWYWLIDNVRWINAENKNNTVYLSGGWFEIPSSIAHTINRISPNLTMSMWVSSTQLNHTLTYNLMGKTNVSITNPGINIGISSQEIYANINGTYYTTTGSVMKALSTEFTNIIFSKELTSAKFYINSIANTTFILPESCLQISSPVIPEQFTLYPSNTFLFGNSSANIDLNFQGILYDMWILKDSVTQQEVNELYTEKPQYWNASNDLRLKAVSHWYGNSIHAWMDDIRNNNATIYSTLSSTRLSLKNTFGVCCSEV